MIHGWSAEEVIGKNHALFFSHTDVRNRLPQHELKVGSPTMHDTITDGNENLHLCVDLSW